MSVIVSVLVRADKFLNSFTRYSDLFDIAATPIDVDSNILWCSNTKISINDKEYDGLASPGATAEFFLARRCECVTKELERASTYGPPTVPAPVILALDLPDLATHRHRHIHRHTSYGRQVDQ